MKYKNLLVACAVSTLASAQANTTNQIIVSATRIDTPIEQMASTVNVITSEDIENTKQKTLTDVLRSAPGISIARNGGPGQSSSIFLRGAKAQHTLVLIDGIRMNGQLELGGYDFTHFQALNIDRIEVLKGPQSTLYGSDAIAGVINITTKQGTGTPTPYYDIEGGSYGTWRAATGVSGGDDLVNFSASVSHVDRQGQSAQDGNREKDGTENTTVSTRIGFTPTDSTMLDFTLRYIDAFSDYDGFPSPTGYYFENEQLATRLQATTLLLDELLETRFGASYLLLDKNNITPTSESPSDSSTVSADWQNTLFLHDNHTVLGGIDWHRDDYDFSGGDGDLDNLGLFATYQAIFFKQLNANIGLRNDKHSEFGNEITYQASTALRVPATRSKLTASWGTGFNAPNSYQLFSSFGNQDLDPETSESWEVGIAQQIISNRLDIGASYFHSDYENFITYFDPDGFGGPTPGRYENIDAATTDGVEVYVNASVLDNLSLRMGYTYLDNDDKSDDITFEIRRPEHKIDLTLNYAATKKLNLNLTASFTGQQTDQDFSAFPAAETELDAFTLVNLATRYQLTDRVEIYGRIDNLLDENYQTTLGFNQDDIAGYAGIKVNL